MSFRLNEPVIDDDNFHSVLQPGGYGLVPRDMSAHPTGSLDGCVTYGAIKDEIPLVPWSDMPDLIAEKVAKKTLTSDIRLAMPGGPFTNLDQGNSNYCVTEDTEILTDRGFVAFPDYNWTDPVGTINPISHMLEFQRPFQKHVYEYDGEMIYSTRRNLDFGVTPDHQMYVRKWNEKARTLDHNFSFVRAGDLGWYSGLLPAPSGQIGTELVELEVPGDRVYSGDDFMALLGILISDGYAGGEGSKNTKDTVSFCNFRKEKNEAVAALATRNGFHESPSHPGVWIRYDARELANWLRSYAYHSGQTGAKFKRIPEIVKVATSRQIEIFLDWFNDRSRDGKQFFSVSKVLIDDLQEIFLRIGKRSTISKRSPKTIKFDGNKSGEIRSGELHVLYVSCDGKLSIERKRDLETDRYKGRIYCVGVPNHTMVTRRNGSTLISSNCWAYASVHALMICRMLASQPTIYLSGHAVGYKIKNGRNQGGWSAHSAEFIMQNGVPSVNKWPAQSWSAGFNNEATWTEAKQYRFAEGFIDLDSPHYDRDLSFQQVLTLLIWNVPCPIDLNWWQHAVLAVDPVDAFPNLPASDPNRYGVRILNSWKNWGDRGMGVLTKSKARPDNACGMRAPVLSS